MGRLCLGLSTAGIRLGYKFCKREYNVCDGLIDYNNDKLVLLLDHIWWIRVYAWHGGLAVCVNEKIMDDVINVKVYLITLKYVNLEYIVCKYGLIWKTLWSCNGFEKVDWIK